MAFDSLPDVVLRRCFKYLGSKDCLSAQKVCRSWQNVLLDSCWWKTLLLTSDLSETDIVELVHDFGHHVESIHVHESQTDDWFTNTVSLLTESADINWHQVCDVEIIMRVVALTGDPDVIPAFRCFLSRCTRLARFVLHDAMVACASYMLLPDPINEMVLRNNTHTLTRFELVNYTVLKYTHCLVNIGECRRLEEIVVSPQHLSAEVLMAAGQIQSLQSLTIMCTCFTTYKNCYVLSDTNWNKFHQAAPKVKVHVALVTEDTRFRNLLQRPSLLVSSLQIECKFLTVIDFQPLAAALEEIVVVPPHDFALESVQCNSEQVLGMHKLGDIIRECRKLTRIGYGCAVTYDAIKSWIQALRSTKTSLKCVDIINCNIDLRTEGVTWSDVCREMSVALHAPRHSAWSPLSPEHFQHKYKLLSCTTHRMPRVWRM